MVKSKPQVKGQRSLASFVFTKPKQDTDQTANQPQAEAPQQPVPAPQPPTEDASVAKRSRHDASGASTSQAAHQQPKQQQQQPALAPSHKPPTKLKQYINPEDRHARWQAKLVKEAVIDPGSRAQRHADVVLDPIAPVPAGVKLTPLELQVQALQRAHPDLVLAIECGYKFRFFGKDAEVASQCLGLFAYPDKHFLSTWVPVPRLHVHARRLVQAGHKVGVVRQVESAAIKAASDNRNKPFERKLTAIHTRATLEAGDLAAPLEATSASAAGGPGDEGDAAGDQQHLQQQQGWQEPEAHWSSEQRSNYLVCVVEEPVAARLGSSRGGGSGTTQVGGGSQGSAGSEVEVGVVAVETSTGDVLYSQFKAGVLRGELESKLMYAAPAELLLVKPMSTPTRRMLSAFASKSAGVRTEEIDGGAYKQGGALAAVTGFYGSKTGATNPEEKPQSQGEAIDDVNEGAVDAALQLPSLVLRALAHALDYLEPFGLGAVLRSGAGFREYSAVGEMALGPNTLQQLEILRNSEDGSEKGSLLWLMDKTLTVPGSRLMRHWVSRPLRDVGAINARLDAVQELLTQGGMHATLDALPTVLSSLPDLERSITRVLHGTTTPPEFLQLLTTFKDLHSKLHLYAASTNGSKLHEVGVEGIESTLLRSLLQDAACLSCAAVARDTLAILNQDAAATGDKINLFMDDERFLEYANRRNDVTAAVHALDSLRPTLAAALNVRSIDYVSIRNQGDYLVEVEMELVKRVPKDWEKISSVKKAVRFRPHAVKQALASLEVAREHLTSAAGAAWKQLLKEFCKHHGVFAAAVRALSALDCLNSLAALANSSGYVRPQFVEDNQPPQLHIKNGRHPILDVVLSNYVPNDTKLGGVGHERCAVITGPNMGGKSSYIRQSALIACMAQVGSFVPAEEVKLRAFDSIFTRMGAADSIALGRSTFLEELSECSLILNQATASSLVIIDELGRGTSTADGTAIAEAVLEHIIRSTQCLTLFVTHYLDVLPSVQRSVPQGSVLGYFMAYETEDPGADEANGTTSTANATIPKVLFLYKVTQGVAEASFGLNVARMAHVPAEVIGRAADKAAEFQFQFHNKNGGESMDIDTAIPKEEGGRVPIDEGELYRLAREVREAVGGGGATLKTVQEKVAGILGVVKD